MVQSDNFHVSDAELSQYLDIADEQAIPQFLNRKIFTVADAPLSYRQINSLDRDEVLYDDRDKGRGWRKFTFLEIIFLYLVNDLKELGFTHEQLKQLRNCFYKEPANLPSAATANEPSRLLSEWAVGLTFGHIEITLAIAPDGRVDFYDPTNFAIWHGSPCYVHITLNHYVNRLLKEMGKDLFEVQHSLAKVYKASRILDVSKKEKELLKIIRNQDYQTIRVKKQGGEVSLVHAGGSNSAELTEGDVIKLLRGREYLDVTVTKRDGKLVNLKAEETIRL